MVYFILMNDLINMILQKRASLIDIPIKIWVERADKKYQLKTSISYALEKGIIFEDIAKLQLSRFKSALIVEIQSAWGSM